MVVEGKQLKCGGGGGTTIEMWWRWKEKQLKCGGGGLGRGKQLNFIA